jgi:hypothetical protein
MSSRPGVQITYQLPTKPSVSPNLYAAEVSSHVRTYWPRQATWEEVETAMARSFLQAYEAAYKKYHSE